MKIYWYPVVEDYMFEIDGVIYAYAPFRKWCGGFIKTDLFEFICEVE